MAMRIPMSGQRLLVESGLVPKNCQSLELTMSPTGAMTLRYEVLVDQEHLDKLASVFQAMASDVKERQGV